MDGGTAGGELIDLGIGAPDPALLPRALLRDAAVAALETGTRCLEYGPEQGAVSLREALAELLTRHYRRPVVAAELLITNGASHGLDLALGLFTSPGDLVVIEAPTYFFGLDVLRDRRVRLLPAPVDTEGIDPEALAARLAGETPALIYTIPAFQNPTGVTLSPPRRRRLVELAAAYGCPVVADEVYQLVVEAGRVPPPMRAYDPERVLSLGSFSKILGPGVRLGWVECAPRYLAALRDNGVLRSGGGASPMTGAIVTAAIRNGGQDRHLATLREVYDRRRRHAVRELSRILPGEVRVDYPEGGYYVWLRLPPRVDARALQAEAVAAGVSFRPGPVFSPDGSFASCLRLCFTYYDEPRLTVAIERLGTVIGARLSAGR
jgi:DNA-binding transcriptional MocR family regulator